MNPRILLRGLVLIATLVGIAWLIESGFLGGFLDTDWIDREVRGRGPGGELLYLGAALLAVAAGMPRQVVGFLGGYAFGFLAGSVLALGATVGGCMLTFTYSRLLARDLVLRRFSGRVRRIDGFIHEHPLSMTLLIRLLPLGSNLATNLAAGVSSVRPAPFFAGSALGYIPQTLVFALIGSGISIDPGLRIGLGVLLFVISALLGAHLYRRCRQGRVLDEALERELDMENGEERQAP